MISGRTAFWRTTGDTQLKVHLRRLVELEYVAARRNGTGVVYELVYDGQGQDGERFLVGLIDPEKLQRSGSGSERSGVGRPLVGPRSVGGRGTRNSEKPNDSGELSTAGTDSTDKRTSQAATSGTSYTKAEK